MHVFFLSNCVFVLRPRYASVEFEVTGLAHKMLTICLYLSKLGFVVSLNNGPSLYIKMKSTVSPDQYDVKSALDESNRKLIV